ncbi:nickel-dependent hydrogenase large subunit [Myxococcota bacterium]|nr:nickel-dependent hydrogenase large subunit [Myxococcota bacterium]
MEERRSKRVIIDPVTRVEGHLRVETEVDSQQVTSARCSSEMFRGIERALIGYDARAAQQITQRVCGVCPYAHAEAAALALEDAMGIKPNPNGLHLRNLIVGAYQLQDALLHFYALCALDFIDITAVLQYQGADKALRGLRAWVEGEIASQRVWPASPFLPRYQASYAQDIDLNISAIKGYLDALPMMANLHKMVAIFGAKAPHPVTIEAGGVTVTPTVNQLARYARGLDEAEAFIQERYASDLIAVGQAFSAYFQEGKGYGDLLSYPFMKRDDGVPIFSSGVTINGQHQRLDLSQIYEDSKYAYYKDHPDHLKPLSGAQLTPMDASAFEAAHRAADGAYTWTRAPRYGGRPMEVGPAARVVNTYHAGINPTLNARVDAINQRLGISLTDYPSVMGRHLSRYLTASAIIDALRHSLSQIQPGVSGFEPHEIPKGARGVGLTEASRGALGHWIETDEAGYIARYEMIVPTTWNFAPRDGAGLMGPAERMLVGARLADTDNPIELARILRALDPCMACSVH